MQVQDTRRAGRRRGHGLVWLALVVLCSCLYTCTSPGRITYPDDEIVFQTTQSVVEDHDLTIAGIPKRTGERADRPNGTFGWGEGRDGRRYGFFGHGLSFAAVPAYLFAEATVDAVPELWRYAIRSDLFTFHARSHEADWLRLVVNLSNCLLTPLGALLLGLWLRVLGHGVRASVITALVYALGTTAWPYAGTFLSEPLTVIVLVGAALETSRWRRGDGRGHLWAAAVLAGLSVHVHVLNLLAIPCLLGYALTPLPSSPSSPSSPSRSPRSWSLAERRTWAVALVLGAAGLATLGLSQWARFGSPFETGRFDHYGHWVWPFEGVVTMLVAPGRSLILYSPPLVIGLLAWPALRRRDRGSALFVLAFAAIRLVFVACRSDWHGGWAIGPRYLIPTVPFLLVPLAGWVERWAELGRAWRALGATLLVVSAPFQAWLASHSVFAVFWDLNREHGRERYMAVADWSVSDSPPLAFWRQQQAALEFWRHGQLRPALIAAKFDTLTFGAWRLAKLRPEAAGLWTLMLGVGVLACCAGLGLVFWLLRTRAPGPGPD